MGSINEILQSAIPGMKLTLGGLLSAVITLLVCLVVIRLLMKLLTRLISRSRLDERVQKYALMALKLLLYAVTVIIVMDALNMNASSLVALLSVASLGITLAAEDILGNMAGGLVILSSRPFAIGDYIETDGTAGTVEEIALNHTKLLTPDGLTVLLPNRSLSGSKLINYTALGRRRVTYQVTASYDAPTEAVKAACLAAVSATPGVLADPAPAVRLEEYGSSSIKYSIFCWCASGEYLDVRFTLGEQLREAFAAQKVEMTYEHLNVHIVGQKNG